MSTPTARAAEGQERARARRVRRASSTSLVHDDHVRVAERGLRRARRRTRGDASSSTLPRKWSRRPPPPPTTSDRGGAAVDGCVERELEVGGVLGGGVALDRGAVGDRGVERRGVDGVEVADDEVDRHTERGACSSPESAAITRSTRRRRQDVVGDRRIAAGEHERTHARQHDRGRVVPWFPPPALPGSGSRGRRRVTVALSARLTRAPRDSVVDRRLPAAGRRRSVTHFMKPLSTPIAPRTTLLTVARPSRDLRKSVTALPSSVVAVGFALLFLRPAFFAPPAFFAAALGRRRRVGARRRELGGELLACRFGIDLLRVLGQSGLACATESIVAVGIAAMSDVGGRSRVHTTGVGAPALARGS